MHGQDARCESKTAQFGNQSITKSSISFKPKFDRGIWYKQIIQ